MPWRQRLWASLEARPAASLAGLVAVAFAIRLVALALTHRTLPAGDELELFVRAARSVLGPPVEDDAGRAPGLLAFYAGVFRLFGVHAFAAKLANAVVSSLTVLPVASIGRRLGGARAGLAAGLGAALYPNFVAFSHFLWPEPLYILLVASALSMLLVAREGAGARAVWLDATAGLLIGASALVKESGVAFAPLAVVWVAVVERAVPRRALAHAAAVAAGAALLLGPFVIALQRPGLPFALVTRTGYMNLFIGNHPHGHAAAMAEYPTLGATRLEAESVARARALDFVAARLPGWPFEKLASELPRFFTPTSFAVRRLLAEPDDPGHWRYRTDFALLDRPLVRGLAVAGVVSAYLATLALGAVGLVLAPRRPAAALLGLFVAAQILPSIVTFAISRFRLPSMVCFLAGAGFAAVGGREAWALASARRRACALGLALALLALAALDWRSVLESTGR